MATGIQSSDSKLGVTVRLVEGATAANGAPSGAAAGFAWADLAIGYVGISELGVQLYSTAGSDVMTLSYARLWGYNATSAKWFPVGPGMDADKGKLNAGLAFGETATDEIRHEEMVSWPTLFDRIYVELGVFGGTATALSVDIVVPRNRRIH